MPAFDYYFALQCRSTFACFSLKIFLEQSDIYTARDRDNSVQTARHESLATVLVCSSMAVPKNVGPRPGGEHNALRRNFLYNKVSEKLSRPEAMKQNWRRSWDEVTAEETSLTNSNLIPWVGTPQLMHEARRTALLIVSSFRGPALRPRIAQGEL